MDQFRKVNSSVRGLKMRWQIPKSAQIVSTAVGELPCPKPLFFKQECNFRKGSAPHRKMGSKKGSKRHFFNKMLKAGPKRSEIEMLRYCNKTQIRKILINVESLKKVLNFWVFWVKVMLLIILLNNSCIDY